MTFSPDSLSRRVDLVRPCFVILFVALVSLAAQTGAVQAQKLSADEAKKLKNPTPFTKKSIAQGRQVFQRYCTGCHGPDGKASIDVVANATDLTDPTDYRDGTTDGEIFRSIRDGAGASMPSFKSQIEQEADMWHLVNYIHSL